MWKHCWLFPKCWWALPHFEKACVCAMQAVQHRLGNEHGKLQNISSVGPSHKGFKWVSGRCHCLAALNFLCDRILSRILYGGLLQRDFFMNSSPGEVLNAVTWAVLKSLFLQTGVKWCTLTPPLPFFCLWFGTLLVSTLSCMCPHIGHGCGQDLLLGRIEKMGGTGDTPTCCVCMDVFCVCVCVYVYMQTERKGGEGYTNDIRHTVSGLPQGMRRWCHCRLEHWWCCKACMFCWKPKQH